MIANAEAGSTFQMTEGDVAEELNLKKSATIEGTNAGKAQNFDQEV